MTAGASPEEEEPPARGAEAEVRVAQEVARPRSGWWLAGLFLLQMLVAGVVGAAVGIDSNEKDAFTTPALGVAAIVAYGVLLAGTIAFARRSGSARAVLALRRPRLVDLAFVPVVLVAVVVAAALINAVFHGGEAQGLDVENHPRDARQWLWLVLAVVVLTIVAPVCEELFFRGAVLSSIAAGRIGRLGHAGISLIASTAVIFGAAHLIPSAFPALAVVGAGLAYLRLRSGSVVPGMLLHVLFNSLAVVAALSAGS
jgi:uncharacterized protein